MLVEIDTLEGTTQQKKLLIYLFFSQKIMDSFRNKIKLKSCLNYI